MEYPQQAWLAFFASVLAAYVLGGWCHSRWTMLQEQPPTGEGPEVRYGYQSYQEDKKPYNSGDPRSGT